MQEALDLHKVLLAQAPLTLDPAALADRLTALAELAEEAGDRPLAVDSLDRLLEQRPHDVQVLEWRFRVDPDRGRALDRLVSGAEEIRSRRSRTRLLALAAAAARDEAHDAGRQRELLQRAAAAARGSPVAEREVAVELLALCRADPSDAEGARALGLLLASDPSAQAEAFLEVADAAPPGPIRASHLAAAASALAEAGQAIRHREAVRAAFEAWPLDDGTFRGALAWAEGDVDATGAVLSLRAAAVPGEAAACHRARADLLLSAGRPGPAARAYEACLAADPTDGDALAGLTEARSAEGDLPGALAAARRGAEVAAAQGRQADRRRVLERGALLAAELRDRGEDAASVLESLALLLLEGGPGADDASASDGLARRRRARGRGRGAAGRGAAVPGGHLARASRSVLRSTSPRRRGRSGPRRGSPSCSAPCSPPRRRSPTRASSERPTLGSSSPARSIPSTSASP